MTQSDPKVGPEQFEPYRRELTGYCYRMLGSIHEADDAVQDTFVRAWRGLATFEDRSDGSGGLRPWLYRIATNVCFDMLTERSRRALPMALGPAATGELNLGTPRPQESWIEPAPDGLLLPTADDPAEVAATRETIRLAFIAALQHLSPRQRAVLILRDVLRWKAREVANLLGTSTDAVNSALRRARAALAAERDTEPREPSVADQELVARYLDAFQRLDIDTLIALLHEDGTLDMPPFELWMQGRDQVRRWLLDPRARCRDARFLPTPVTANSSPALALYQPSGPGGAFEPYSIHVLETSGDRIAAIHVFIDPGLFGVFDLPAGPDIRVS